MTTDPIHPSATAAGLLLSRSAALRATHALLIEIEALQPVGQDRAQARIRLLETVKGAPAGREATLVVPTAPPVPTVFHRLPSPWELVPLRAGAHLLALAETRESALDRVLAYPALRSLWPGEAGDDVRALLAAERQGADAGTALRVAASRRAQGGPLLGEWLLVHLVEPLASRGPLLDEVRALLAAPDTSADLREALARGLYEAALFSWESEPGHALALAQALVEATLRPETPAPLQRRLLAGEVRAVLTETRPAPSAVALLPDAGARARLRTALAAVGPSAGGALGTWLA